MKKLLAILILACSVLFACKKGNENFVSTTTLLNAAIDMPAITLNLNNDTAIANITFGSVRYNASNPSGTYTLTFTAAGIGALGKPINTGFSSGGAYTAIVYDSAKAVDTINHGPHLYFQKDIFPASITDGKCLVRFFDLIPDTVSTGHIFVKIDTGSTVIAGKYYFLSKSCGDFGSSNAFVEADTTTSVLKVVRDTTSALKLLDSYNLGLKNGKIYSIYLIGAFGEMGSKKPRIIVYQHN